MNAPRSVLIILALAVSWGIYAQPGGANGFPILELPSGGRSMALGGTVVAMTEGDVTLVHANPALMDSTRTGDFAFQYSPFSGGINLLNVVGNVSLPRVSNLTFGISYMNYGELARTDNIGNNLGAFVPQDFLLYLSKSHRISSFAMGASLKFVHSSIDGFGASALMMDLGGTWTHPSMELVAAVVLKNLGFTVNSFDSQEIPVPLDLQVGLSFKPRYMPARFSINAHHLIDGDLRYFDQSVLADDRASFGKGLLRHVNVGMEILIGQYVNVLVGYNHLRNQELKLEQGAFGAGFSFGFMVKVKNLRLRYSRAIIHAGGGLNSIGLEGNFSDLTKIF